MTQEGIIMTPTIEISTLTGNANGNSSNSLKLRSFTVKEYDSLINAGFFDKNDSLELLNGVIIEKMPKGAKHSSGTYQAARIFFKLLDDKAVVRVQDPIWLDEFSEPEPDIVLAEHPFQNYFDNHPIPSQIFLILEISDTTLNFDRNAKSLAYARAGIRQYLLLNINEKTLEDYREPNSDGFQSKQTYRAGQTFSLDAFPEVELSVKDFLPVEKV